MVKPEKKMFSATSKKNIRHMIDDKQSLHKVYIMFWVKTLVGDDGLSVLGSRLVFF